MVMQQVLNLYNSWFDSNIGSTFYYCPADKCKLVQLPDLDSGFFWVRLPGRAPNNADVAQRQEAGDLKSPQCGFESHRPHHRKLYSE